MTTGRSATAGHDCRGNLLSLISNRGVPFLALLLLTVSCRSPGKGGADTAGALYPEEILSAAERQQEVSAKERRVLEWLRRQKLSAVLLASPHSYAWITAGGCGCLGPAVPCCAPLLIRDDGRKFFFDYGGRRGRILSGEMRLLGYEIRQIPWFDCRGDAQPPAEMLKDLTGGRLYASELPRVDARSAASEIAALRVPLTEWEVRKYRWLGRSCAGAVDSVCRGIERWSTDRGIETLLYKELIQRSISPLEVQVEADTEVPGTATRKVADSALISVRASRWGLVVAMKRAIHFGPLPPALGQRQEAAAGVAAGLWARTVPGATGGAILEAAVADYARVGLTDEWRRSAPGGMIGYLPREWEAAPGAQDQVREFEAFAWNSTAGDFAIEDTLLLDGDRLVVLTEIPGWPVIESKALGRIYRLPAILRIDR